MMKVGFLTLLGIGLGLSVFAQNNLSRAELEQKVTQLEEEVDFLRENDEELRIEELQDRLAELKDVDKRLLTSEEKKAWKREKRAVENELTALRAQNDPWLNNRFAYPYGVYGNYWAWGNPYRFGRFNRAFYRRPVCVVPVNQVRVQRTTRARVPARTSTRTPARTSYRTRIR